MNPLTFPLRLPLLPLKGVVRLGEVIQHQAEREMADPARVRRELEETERRQASGEISDDQAAELEEQAVSRYTRERESPAAVADEDEG
jgi:Gas vesicle protein G